MVLTVKIERRKTGNLEGILIASVVDNGQRGTNLLSGHQFSRVSSAMECATRTLYDKCGPVAIKWELPPE